MLEQIVDAGREMLHADRASVLLLDSERDELYSEATSAREEIRFPADKGIAGETLSQRCVIRIDDCYSDARFNREVDRQTGYRTQSLISIPLIGDQEKTVGVMQLLNSEQGTFNDDDEHLADLFSGLAALAIQRTQAFQVRLQKAKMERDLDVARTIQENLLPKTIPNCLGYDLAAFSLPADETGGDIYDFIPMDVTDERSPLTILLADATGHGIGAAVSVTQVRAMLRIARRLDSSLDTLCRHLNAQLLADLPLSKFVTVFVGTLDPSTNLIEYHSLGQAPLLHYHAEVGECHWLPASAPPAGLTPNPPLNRPGSLEVAEGDIFVLLSDGFYEYANRAGEEMEKERIGEVIALHSLEPATEILEGLRRAVNDFAEGAPQSDDLTAIIIKRSTTAPRES
jgi:phosphoserine phosphatase